MTLKIGIAMLLVTTAVHAAESAAPEPDALPRTTRDALQELDDAVRPAAFADDAQADAAVAASMEALAAEVPPLSRAQFVKLLVRRQQALVPWLVARLPRSPRLGAELLASLADFTRAEQAYVAGAGEQEPKEDSCLLDYGECLARCLFLRSELAGALCALDCEIGLFNCLGILDIPPFHQPERGGSGPIVLPR